ncbi:hypothetical protein OF83DRAFT_1123530 [Amylostereum chailletii]|nr:hypothetical protein OF83DRAFT_1123530 [Amylostereum chailletii]
MLPPPIGDIGTKSGDSMREAGQAGAVAGRAMEVKMRGGRSVGWLVVGREKGDVRALRARDAQGLL